MYNSMKKNIYKRKYMSQIQSNLVYNDSRGIF